MEAKTSAMAEECAFPAVPSSDGNWHVPVHAQSDHFALRSPSGTTKRNLNKTACRARGNLPS